MTKIIQAKYLIIIKVVGVSNFYFKAWLNHHYSPQNINLLIFCPFQPENLYSSGYSPACYHIHLNSWGYIYTSTTQFNSSPFFFNLLVFNLISFPFFWQLSILILCAVCNEECIGFIDFSVAQVLISWHETSNKRCKFGMMQH